MSLSNTAVPIYYGEFRDKVLNGSIPVCSEISMQMNIVDQLIESPDFYYDDEAVNGWVDFCENELTLTDGSDLHLLDTFKLWGEDIFGWYYFTERNIYVPGQNGQPGHYELKTIKKRLRNIQYIITSRGSAKSMFASTVQAYFCAVDPSTTDQFVVAPTMRQADETLAPIRTALARARGPLFKFLTDGSVHSTKGSPADHVKMAPTKKGIQNFITNSLIEVRPMSIDKLQGARPRISNVDEWLSGDVKEDVIGAIEQGASKLPDYLILATSSEGTVRNGVGDSIKMELHDILRGDYWNPHVSIWYYKLDDIREVGNPAMWMKASPNIGITVSYETYQLDVERAEKNPDVRNDILAKRFGIPMEGFTYYFTYEETLPTKIPQNYNELPCAMGADLSQGDDFCAFTFMFPLGGNGFGVKTRCYITQRTYDNLPQALRVKYQHFINEDSLVIMDDSVLKIPKVYDDLTMYIEKHSYTILAFGYDPYNSREFVDQYIAENGAYAVEKVIQGSKTESVPLGELKHYAEDKQLLFDQEIMEFCMGNAIAITDTNGNRKLYKKRREEKIDAVAAMLDAYVIYKRYENDFF